jgi:hypothetical protein
MTKVEYDGIGSIYFGDLRSHLGSKILPSVTILQVSGYTHISDKAHILGGKISGIALIGGNAVINEGAEITKGTITSGTYPSNPNQGEDQWSTFGHQNETLSVQ